MKPTQTVIPRRKRRPLAHRVERLERAPVEQPEVAGVLGQVDLGEAREEAVEPAGRRELHPRLARRARCAPRRRRPSRFRQCSIIVRISSGGSWRSASIITITSPRAWSRPAVIAAWWPKLRESVIDADARVGRRRAPRGPRRCRRRTRRRRSAARSRCPISASPIRRWNSRSTSRSLWTGSDDAQRSQRRDRRSGGRAPWRRVGYPAGRGSTSGAKTASKSRLVALLPCAAITDPRSRPGGI